MKSVAHSFAYCGVGCRNISYTSLAVVGLSACVDPSACTTHTVANASIYIAARD